MESKENDDAKSDAADGVAEEYRADVFIYSGAIENKGFGLAAECIAANKRRDNALLILTTSGGDANAAYQIARLFQRTYAKFIIYTPSYCKSAGTLIALGAHELIMDPFSELGPLDVQLMKENEIGVRKSGLLAKSSFESLAAESFNLFEHFLLSVTTKSGGLVGFKLASELSAQITSSVMSGIYGQINPDVVGSDYRDTQVALHYGLRLIQYSKNASPLSVIHLVEHYPAHDFIIDAEEADDLFINLGFPSDKLYDLIALLGPIAYDESNPISFAKLDRTAPLSIATSTEADHADDGNEHAGDGSEPLDESGDTNRPGNSSSEGAL